ncbi:MAG: RNA polymerase sigma factor [Kofleriaceae bacterium]
MTGGKLLPFKRVHGTAAELSDRALVSAVAEGDQVALGALFDRFHSDVYRFVAHLVRRDASSAEDLAQMTFLEAHRSAPRFRGDSTVKTWLFGIATNVVRTHFRKEHRSNAAKANLEAMPAVQPPAPNEALSLEQQRRLLTAAVDSLSPGLREVYVLCVIEEVPGKEAAQILGIREASVYRRLSDARTALRAAIEEMQA